MLLPDVNIFIYAFRRESPRHKEFQAWLRDLVKGPASFGISDVILSGFIRVVTNPRVFIHPDPTEDALEFCRVLRSQPTCVAIAPGPRHWEIFEDLCIHSNAKGNLIPDAFLAALAIEHGCEFVTSDRDYARFPGLRWRHPLE